MSTNTTPKSTLTYASVGQPRKNLLTDRPIGIERAMIGIGSSAISIDGCNRGCSRFPSGGSADSRSFPKNDFQSDG